MSIGNLKDSGNQGNNFPWQWKMLLGQQGALDELIAINANTDQVEGLLNQILAAILTGQDYEAMLVVDAANVTWLEVRIYNPDTGTFNPPVYFLAGSNTPGTPTAPITYINPNTYLATIASNTTGLLTQSDFDSKTGALTETAPATDTASSGLNGRLQRIAQRLSSLISLFPTSIGQKNMAGSLSVTLANNQLGIARTPGILRPINTSGNVSSAAATFFSVSIANVGTVNGTILGGTTIKPGEALNFSADAVNNYFTSFAYDATGTEFIIIYVS